MCIRDSTYEKQKIDNPDSKGRLNNKLDNRPLVWESEWSNFREATEFSEMFMEKYFFKQKLSWWISLSKTPASPSFWDP